MKERCKKEKIHGPLLNLENTTKDFQISREKKAILIN